MLKNYFKIAWRTLKKNRLYTGLNIFGLTLGISGFLMIMLFIQDELSYDRHFPGSESVFRVSSHWGNEGAAGYATAPPALGPRIREEIPEVEAVTRLLKWNDFTIQPGSGPNQDQIFREDLVFYAEPDFFNVFDLNLKAGSKTTALSSPNHVVITESMAKKYFGDISAQEVLGKALLIGSNDPIPREIAAVVEDLPSQSHLHFDLLVYEPYMHQEIFLMESWSWSILHTYVKFGDSDDTKIGEWVLAVGNPFNLNSTVTAGIISAKARNIGILRGVENNLQIESFLQTDAVVNPGNSGGALVNLAGELIGINTAIATSTGTFTGYSFAVPSTLVKKVMDDLMKYGAVQRGLLGVNIQNVSPELSDYLNKTFPVEQGVYVGGVNDNSAGKEAGLKEGDIIIGIDGKSVNNVANLQELVARRRPGDKVEVEYIRDGKTSKTSATLKNFSGDTEIVKREVPKTYTFEGLQFEDLKEDLKESLEIQGGAMIKSNGNESWRKAGARNGFIITSIISDSGRTRINNAQEMIDFLENSSGEELVILGMFPDGTEYYFEVGGN